MYTYKRKMEFFLKIGDIKGYDIKNNLHKFFFKKRLAIKLSILYQYRNLKIYKFKKLFFLEISRKMRMGGKSSTMKMEKI